jgi:hypothetical protein
MGFATGAISGTFFGYVGFLGAEGIVEGIGTTIAHTVAGVASGAAGAAITGSDIGMGAAIGGISAGAAEFLGSNVPFLKDVADDFSGNLIRRSAIGAIVGGGVSSAFGGSFGRGAQYGAISSSIGYVANHWLSELLAKMKIGRTSLNKQRGKARWIPIPNHPNGGVWARPLPGGGYEVTWSDIPDSTAEVLGETISDITLDAYSLLLGGAGVTTGIKWLDVGARVIAGVSTLRNISNLNSGRADWGDVGLSFGGTIRGKLGVASTGIGMLKKIYGPQE